MIRVGVVAPEFLVRAGIRALLDEDGEVSVVADGAPSRALYLMNQVHPTVLVASSATAAEAVSLLRGLNRQAAPPRTVVLADALNRSGFRALLAARAAGILHRDAARQHLPWAVRAVAQGGFALQPALASEMVDAYLGPVCRIPERSDAEALIGRLSARELDVLRLLADGHATPEIAVALRLTPGTVKSYQRSVYEKLGVSNRIRAVKILWSAATSHAS